MTLDNMTGITEGSYTGFCKSQLITCNRVKECNGVCPFEDALKHADKTQTMNDQHTIDHDRDWIIGCIEHDGFIHTHRFDKANQIIHDALSAEAEPTVIRSRTLMPTKDFKEWAKRVRETNPNAVVIPCDAEVVYSEAVQIPIKLEKRYPESKDEDITDAFMRGYLAGRSSAEAVQGWIPCSERLPKAEDMYQPPEQRYLCQLEAYGERKFCVLSRLKGAVSPFWDWYGVAVHDSEVIAWMPLPKPYTKGDNDEER